jgi:hypothetical protein
MSLPAKGVVPTYKDGGIAELRTALGILCGSAPEVAQSLVGLALNAKSEMARLYATTAVLDRVGIGPKAEIGVKISLAEEDESYTGPKASDILRGRLTALEQSGFTVIDGGVDDDSTNGDQGGQ